MHEGVLFVKKKSLKPTLTDVATRAGVSIATVSRALSGVGKVRPDTLRALIAACGGERVALLTVDTGEDAGAYGRIVRDAGARAGADAPVHAIVEAKDASAEQRALTEWYSGVMAAPTRLLKKYLAQLDDRNAQKEFYLTDVVKHAVAGGTPVQCLNAAANALTSLMGLVCDPVAGLVEVPCQKRNAAGAAVALVSAEIALAGIGNLVDFDQTVDAMFAVGKSLPFELRESALGGLAATPAAYAYCESCLNRG